MSENLNATCSICGNKYHLCISCSNTKTFMPWRSVSCSIDCYKIYMILNDYTNGRKTKSETRELLINNGASINNTYDSDVAKVIKDILSSSEENKETETTVNITNDDKTVNKVNTYNKYQNKTFKKNSDLK